MRPDQNVFVLTKPSEQALLGTRLVHTPLSQADGESPKQLSQPDCHQNQSMLRDFERMSVQNCDDFWASRENVGRRFLELQDE